MTPEKKKCPTCGTILEGGDARHVVAPDRVEVGAQELAALCAHANVALLLVEQLSAAERRREELERVVAADRVAAEDRRCRELDLQVRYQELLCAKERIEAEAKARLEEAKERGGR